MHEEPDDAHWERAMAFVSLDLVAPFLEGVGLIRTDNTRLRATTRALLLDDTAGDPDPPWRDRWLDGVEAVGGTAERDALDRWVRQAFSPLPSTHQDWIAWNTTFSLVPETEAGFVRLGLPREAIPKLLTAFAIARDVEELELLERSHYGKDLSLWDVQMCAAYGIMPDEEDDPIWAWVRISWDNHRFQIFFGQVMGLLDDAARDTLFQRARALRRADALDVARLVPPASLVPAVPWERGA